MKIRKFSGAGQVTEDIDSPSRQADMAKMLAEANNPEAIGTTSPKYKNMDEFMASRKVEPVQETYADLPIEPKAKPKVVTLQQLNAFKAKYGADKDLTDYMNAQKGLTRRLSKSTLPSEDRNPNTQAMADTIDYGEVLQSRETGRSRGSVSENKKTGKPSNAGQKAKRMPGPFSGMAKGGSVSSRADGIAQRGKTRGRMC